MNQVKLLLGVAGSIAAHRALDIASEVVKQGGEVRVVMTEHAKRLIQPAAFEAITGHRVTTSLWDSEAPGEMDHLALTKWANTFCVAPATAAVIARLAHGMAEDALSTLVLAWPGSLIVAPAMNPTMYENPFVTQNIKRLVAVGHHVIQPTEGRTACGDLGIGRLAPVDDILEVIETSQGRTKGRPKLQGETLLITSGPTREFADPVRCITNPSTGRMGFALARQAKRSGARVILITGPTELPVDHANLDVVKHVTTAEEMKDAVLKYIPQATCAIFAAAVSDWRPEHREHHKVKKESSTPEMIMRLVRTPDVALEASRVRRPEQFFIGFAAESEELEENARQKLHKKSFDMIVANPITEVGSGFQSDTNQATLVDGDWRMPLPKMTKDQLALEILSEFEKRKKQRENPDAELDEQEAPAEGLESDDQD